MNKQTLIPTNKSYLKCFIRLFILLLFPMAMHAQFSISGVIKGGDEALEFANVVLRDTSQNLIGGTTTMTDGYFTFTAPKGLYILKGSYLGYQDWIKEIELKQDLDLGNIVLSWDAENMEEVVVTAKKVLIENKVDRIVFNIGDHVAGKGGTAMDALGIAPGVVVDSRSINMLGKGNSRVMINGRLLELTGEDLINYLKSISSEDIKNIEIITNPPAKYDAGSMGGLINLNLRKGALNSWKNIISTSYTKNKFAFGSLTNSFFYNKDKISVSANVSGTKGYAGAWQEQDIFYPNGLWSFRYDPKRQQDKVSGRFSLDYILSPNTTIGFQYMGNRGTPTNFDQSVINVYNSEAALDSFITKKGINQRDRLSHTANTHLIQKFKKEGKVLTMDLDYFSYAFGSMNDFKSDAFTPNGEFLNIDLAGNDNTNQNIKNYSVKVDMEHPTEVANLSYGAKVSFTNSQSGRQFFNTKGEIPVLDNNQSNNFEYQENNQAVYLSGNRDLTKKISMKIGLRLENTQTEGFNITQNLKNINNYFKLFPTFFLSYQYNDDHYFNWNYGKRINRPPFWILNPFRSYINSKSYSEGNPFVQPSFRNNFEFTHVFKRKLRTNLFLNISTDGFGVIFTSDPITNFQIVSRDNYYKQYNYGLAENYSTELTKWLQTSNTLAIINAKSIFNDKINAEPINSVQVYISSRNTFSINKTTRFQMDATYQNPFERGLYKMDAYYGLNLGFQKTFLQDKLNISFLFNDIFRTSYLKNYTSFVNGVKQSYDENNSSRFFRVSVNYQFGNKKINNRARDFGNDEERNRSKN